MPNSLPRCRVALLFGLAALLPAAPALAQLRSLAVPAEAGVVVAARGQAQPRLVAPPAALRMPEEPPAPVQLPAGGQGLAGPLVGVVLPMAAGALLGTGLGSAGGSGGGPVRTR